MSGVPDAAIAACPDYEAETCRAALRQVLAPFGGLAWVKPGMRIAVKANLVSAMKPERAATTHPMLLRVLTEALVRRGASVVVGDSPGGTYAAGHLNAVYRACGLAAVEEAGGTLNRNFAQREAARIAQLADFIASCDGGLSYEIRQAGKNLSGGQKQRLAIARAIIKDAPIYIFDDSFSALDFLTEKNLRTALNRRIAGRTQIVVTQRITSAMGADCIFVMDGGCLVDSGTHNELLARCRIYREIYASQTGGDLQ